MRLAIVLAILVACHHEPPAAKPKVVVTDAVIEKLPQVDFVADTDEIAPGSLKTLDAVAASLAGNLDIALVEVRTYVTGSGGEPARQELADRRAQHLVDYLVGKGVKAERLSAKGVVQPTGNPPVFAIVKRN